MPNIFKQYSSLRREEYVLFFGRMMTCLGLTVNSMMSLILANKMGKSAYEIASVFLLFAIIQLSIGNLVDTITIVQVWTVIGAIGAVAISLFILLRYFDKKSFPMLYGKK